MNEQYELNGPIPPTIGRVADLYKGVTAIRLLMEKEVKKVRARESELKEHMIDNLSKSDDQGAVGLKYRVQLTKTVKPVTKDWEQVYDYIVENDRFDMLQKRLGDRAVLDIYEETGYMPKGIEKFNAIGISVTKK